MNRLVLVTLSSLSLLTACGPKECSLTDPNTCPTEQICETVTGRDKPLCFAPVELKGKVYDLTTSSGIEAAQVLATDENGAAAGASATTAKDGTYTLRIPSVRTDDKGTFTARKVMLRSQAKNYVPFPSGARVSLPVDTSAAARQQDTEPYVLQSSLTDVGLSPVASSEQGRPSISGTVELSADQKAVLVLLENGSAAGRTTLTDATGKFTFFNAPSGSVHLSAYSRGVNYAPADVSVSTSDVTDVQLKKTGTSTASLSGSVQLVAGANNAGTSVVLVLEATFIESLGRGEVPPGLRAPEGGTAPNISGAWTIGGIPDGKYVVLAAFENDDNVRDPDPGISGTQILHVQVSGGSLSGASSPQFKVTGAVGLVGPGASGVDETSATPTFSWDAYSNADAWVLRVFDSLGNVVWSTDIATKATTSMAYGGPALTAGQYYQWRITAMRRGAPTSQSEELRGLFRVKN